MNKETLMEFLLWKDSNISVFTTQTLKTLDHVGTENKETRERIQVELARRLFNDQ